MSTSDPCFFILDYMLKCLWLQPQVYCLSEINDVFTQKQFISLSPHINCCLLWKYVCCDCVAFGHILTSVNQVKPDLVKTNRDGKTGRVCISFKCISKCTIYHLQLSLEGFFNFSSSFHLLLLFLIIIHIAAAMVFFFPWVNWCHFDAFFSNTEKAFVLLIMISLY